MPPPADREDAYLDWFLTSAFDAEDGESADARVSFAEEPEDEALPERIGPYPVAERIGRGGIANVYRVVDPELGRDLAIKVLRTAHLENEDLVRRFLEEARICSRLQHPGVVPVHEMGRLDDGRPYFTMKIVDGHTLARLLRDRGDPRRELRRFLDIFERVCATLSFAHSHGTTHGDLTPRNVMVGAFGEVQVMDWGFARTAETRARRAAEGADAPAPRILGTPAYLAPEQARGERDEVGPPTDVFGLGAILCEILTGAPPYLGDTKADLLLRASKGWLDDAHARLEACAPDAELVDLCRRCLAPAIADRPADAGVVAREIREHLSSLEERLRVVERERIEAVAAARQERRVRRLSIALGAVALLAVLVPGAIHLKNVQERSARRAETEGAIARSMERARVLLADDRLERTTDPTAFSEPLKAAREAELLARLPTAAPGSLPAARALVEEILGRRARAADDVRTADRLRNLRMHFSDARTELAEGRTWRLGADGGGTWVEATPPDAPSPRLDHAMTALGDGSILLFGGAPTRDGPLLNDTWVWDGAAWTRREPRHAPPVRTGHALTFDPVRGRAVLFGGNASPHGTIAYHSDTWEWDGEDWLEIETGTSPPRRDWAGFAFDPRREVALLFGGRDSDHRAGDRYEPYGDTWAWDGAEWTRRTPTTSPPKRHGHRLVHDRNLDALVLVGGQYPGAPGYDDTWIWDGEDWRELSPAAKYPGRAFFGMAFDRGRGRLVLHGGRRVPEAVLLEDTWEFDGETWTRVAAAGPAYAWSPLCADARHGGLLLQGGSTGPNRSRNVGGRFAEAFREAGIDVQALDAEAAAERVRESTIRRELVDALDEWSRFENTPPRTGSTLGRKLVRVANLADADRWRHDVRDALQAGDVERLRRTAAEADDAALPVTSLALLASSLAIVGAHDEAIDVYRRACFRDPSDFNVHARLADLLEFADPDAGDEVLRLLSVALALQPDSLRTLHGLARLLSDRGRHREATVYLERAVVVDKDHVGGWRRLGRALAADDRTEEAVGAFEEAVRRGEWLAEVDLALALRELGRIDEAIAAARHAASMLPNPSFPRAILGALLGESGRPEEAIEVLEEALRRDPFDATAHLYLGRALGDLGRLEEARASLRRGLRLAAQPDVADACRAALEELDPRPGEDAGG
ncbi:MAG: protein kinase [Planctomycetota bacterium JB042]